MLKKVPYFAIALALPLPAFALHAPQDVPGTARPAASPTDGATATPEPLDHAINTKGTGASNGRMAQSPADTATPTPQPQDHAINSQGTGGNNGGVKHTTGTPAAVDPCRNPGPCPPPS
jgi:hypothetical protein